MKKEFNQKEYIKEYQRENYKQFKTKLKHDEMEEVNQFLKDNNMNKREFILKSMKIWKGEFYMYKDEVSKYLEENKIEAKDWFKETFCLGNYGEQDPDEEETINIKDGSVFIIVDKDHEYACVSVFDENEMQYALEYLTYSKTNELINRIK